MIFNDSHIIIYCGITELLVDNVSIFIQLTSIFLIFIYLFKTIQIYFSSLRDVIVACSYDIVTFGMNSDIGMGLAHEAVFLENNQSVISERLLLCAINWC